MELIDLRALLDEQSGVIARRQLLEAGATSPDLRRWLRSRDLTPVFKGVYVNHTGPLSWSSRAWASVQRYWPAALALGSAVHLAGDVIHVAVAEGRSSVAAEPGVLVHRLRDFESRIQWNRTPPRQRLEDAVISLCRTGSRRQAVDLLTEACRSRRTTPARLRRELAARPNTRDRAWLLAVLDDAAGGVQSVLESVYLRRVERAHGLPRAERQVREATVQGVVYRDALYRAWGVLVELDGRLGHEAAGDRAADLARDLDAAARGLLTLRVGWHQAELEPCATASGVAAVLGLRGWRGQARSCGPHCVVGQVGGVVRIGART